MAFQPIVDVERREVFAYEARVAGVISACGALGVKLVAEGVETRAEYDRLRAMGVTLFQGYLIARPGLESLPELA